MSETPSYEYEVLHQFEAIFRDGEHKTQAATRDYQKVWENVIDNPPEEGVTPIVVYRMNGSTCAAIAGLDDLVDNEECAMEIARLAARVAELECETQRRSDEWAEAIGTIRAIGHAVGCEGDEAAVLAAVRRMAAENATLRAGSSDGTLTCPRCGAMLTSGGCLSCGYPSLRLDAMKAAYETSHASRMHAEDAARRLEAERDEARRELKTLIYAVGNKYPGESRYETALRYIREAERWSDVAAQDCSSLDRKAT